MIDETKQNRGLRAILHSRFSLYLMVVVVSLASSVLTGRLIPQHVPHAHDEFAYLLAGQTYAHFRLTNPTPALPQFFDAPHVLVEPSYIAKYPPGQGLVLAMGYWLGAPIAGVWLSNALFAAAVAWMLRGFFSRRWALLGGLLAIAQWGLLNYWNQSFWGGALAAAGGALVFGGARRIARQPRARDAAGLGLGIIILMLTRPVEGVLACVVPAGIFAHRVFRLLPRWRVILGRLVLPCGAVVVAGGAFLAYDQFRVTGSPWRSPYLEYESQHSGAPLFFWQKDGPEPAFQNSAIRDFYREYVVPMSHAYPSATRAWIARIGDELRNFIGVFLGAIAAFGLLLSPRRWSLLALGSAIVVSLNLAACRWYSLHYQAPAAALYLFLAVAGLRTMVLALPRLRRHWRLASALVVTLQLALVANSASGLRSVARTNPSTLRQRFLETLQPTGNRFVVFVRLEKPYDPNLAWVYNDARLADSQVIWAWDRGTDEDRRLLAAYPGRVGLLMTLRGEHTFFTGLPAVSLPP